MLFLSYFRFFLQISTIITIAAAAINAAIGHGFSVLDTVIEVGPSAPPITPTE